MGQGVDAGFVVGETNEVIGGEDLALEEEKQIAIWLSQDRWMGRRTSRASGQACLIRWIDT